MGPLTAATVRSLGPGRHGDRRGSTLYLVVQASGARSWVQRLVITGKRHDIGLGGFPLVSLKEARERAFANRKLARDGGDPLAAKRRPHMPTFREAAQRTFEAMRGRWRSAKTASNWTAALEKYAHPVFGDRRVDQVDREAVLGVLVPIWTSKPELARKLRRRIRGVLQWSRAHGYVASNAAGEDIDGALVAQPAVGAHLRALPYRELPAALKAIETSTASLSARACLRFVALTACRGGEARHARWTEVDLGAREWRVPATRMKSNREHRVPLAGPVVELLERVRPLADSSDLLFPAPRRGGKPLSDATLGKVLRSAGLADRTTPHALRATFRTWCSEQTAVPHAVAELALAHQVGDSVERSYARSDLYAKRAGLMERWAAFATGDSAKVVRLQGAELHDEHTAILAQSTDCKGLIGIS